MSASLPGGYPAMPLFDIAKAPRVLTVCWAESRKNRPYTGPQTNQMVVFGEDGVSAEMERNQMWDLIIATEGAERFYATHSPQDIRRFALWAKNSSRLLLMPPRLDLINPGAFDLGPHRIPLEFENFSYFSELGSQYSVAPIIGFSDHYFFDGESWHSSTSLREVGARRRTQSWDFLSLAPRTFISNDTTILKTQVSSPDYFESNDVAREAKFLSSVEASGLAGIALPLLQHSTSGHVVSTLARQKLEGSLLEVSSAGLSDAERQETARGLVDLACSLASHRIFHNDFRPWNILQTRNGFTMIDYADVGKTDLDVRNLPQVVALAGSLVMALNLSWEGKHVRDGEHFDSDALGIFGQYAVSTGVRLEELYGDAWLALPRKKNALLKAVGSDLRSVFDLLFLEPT